MSRILIMAATIACLCACGQSERDVSGVSASEAKALNDAAARLDAQTPSATDDPALNATSSAVGNDAEPANL